MAATAAAKKVSEALSSNQRTGTRTRLMGQAVGGRSRRFRKKYTKASRKRRRLYRRVGLGSKAKQVYVKNRAHRFAISAGDKSIAFVGSSDQQGTDDKAMLDAVYANEAFTDADQGVYITNQSSEYIIANQSNGPVWLTIRVVKFKKQWTTTMGTSLNTDLIAAGFNRLGLDNSVSQVPGITIYDNSTFPMFCKVIRSKQLNLAPGQVRKFKLQNPNSFYRKFRYKNESDILHLKGSVKLLFEAHGPPVHDQTTATNIDLATTVLDIYESSRVVYYVADGGKADSATVDVSNITTPATPLRFLLDEITETAPAT